jgi:hypothetical protein
VVNWYDKYKILDSVLDQQHWGEQDTVFYMLRACFVLYAGSSIISTCIFTFVQCCWYVFKLNAALSYPWCYARVACTVPVR